MEQRCCPETVDRTSSCSRGRKGCVFYDNEKLIILQATKIIQNDHIANASYLSGEISLRPAATNLLGGNLVKGNVYLDEKPVCDDGFGREEARVVCRSLFAFF